jgi:hypothetical protein
MADHRGMGPGRRFGAAREWVGGRLTAPMYITEGEPYRPDVILWLELPEGYIVGTEILHPNEPVGRFADVLRSTMQRPAVGAPRRPQRVRVAQPALADVVRGALGEQVRIAVAPTPELDAVMQDMAGALAKVPGDEPESYFESGRVSPGVVADLFKAAHLLYTLAPWKRADDSQVLRVDIPRLDVSAACLSIIGALGESVGILLFPSLDGFDAFLAAAERGDRGRIDLGGTVLSLTFERGAEIPAAMRREVAEHQWPVAGADAYPRVEMRDRDGTPRPLTERDVRVMAACARSLAALCVKHGDPWSRAASEPICESWDDGAGLAVRFTVPYEADHLFPINDSVPAAPAGGARVGRNDPCPCGSGKKYKKCHLEADAAAAASSAPRDDEVNDRRVVEQIFAWTARRFGPGSWAKTLSVAHDDSEAAQIVVPWCAYHAEIDGRRIAERFLDANERRLSPAEREWLDAQLRAWLSLWEVTAVEPGAGVHVSDLLTGETRFVAERTASRTLTGRETLLARVVDHAGSSTFCGLAPRALPPAEADAVVQQVRARLRLRRAVAVERLRDEAIGAFMLARWSQAVAALKARAAIPPRLTNTDGDALLFTTDHYTVEAAAHDEVARRLAALGAVDTGEASASERCWELIRPDRDAGDEGTIIGRLRLADSTLAVETNSVARADDLRQRIEAACGALVRHRLREHSDPRALLARGAGPQPPSAVPGLDPAEQARIEREYKQRHYQRWLDEPIPALDGQTPRQAARTRAGRHRVDVLLRDIEHREGRLPAERRVDVTPLRHALGLDP